MKRICQLFLLHCLIIAVISENYYSINAPGLMKPNRKYSVVVTLHEASGPCSIRVTIEGPSFNDSRDVNLEPFESKLIDFFPKRLIWGHYELKAEGLSGLEFKNASEIYVASSYGPKIYIQTDKGVYKPEDIVRFRVAILDQHTRPLYLEDPIYVEILDEEDNRVKLINNVTLTKGVYTGRFQLAKYPDLGDWKIKVVLGGNYNYTKNKYIKIYDYVLPKFSVYIKTPSDVVLDDGSIRVVIFGKYVFDKYVEGNATIELWNYFKEDLLQIKHIEIETLGFVEFDIKNVKNIDFLRVTAKLTEKYTGITQSHSQDINVHQERYKLVIPDDEIEFENNKPYRLNVYVKHWTGAPVLDHKTPVTMEHGSEKYEAYLNDNGVATFEFEHEENADHKFQFKGSKGKLPNLYTNENLMLNNREYYCRLKLVNEKLKLGKPVEIEVSSIRNIPYLMYIVMGHASLIQMQHVKLTPNQKSYTISITPSIEMIPKSFIYVYYIHKGNLRYEEMQLSFPDEFENQISLLAPKEVKPGENVTITINAQTKSYVSILAVDLGVYLLDNKYDLYKFPILDELRSETSSSPVIAVVYPGLLSGLLTLTNAHYPFVPTSTGIVAPPVAPWVYNFRKKFPETWIFDNFWINETTTELTLPIPDDITTWRITAFSNNDVTGFGIVNGPTDITAIQPLFITTNLPYSVKRGEIVTIPITIFNYLNQTADTEVVLHNNDQEFHFMKSKIQEVNQSTDEPQQTKHISIEVNKAKTVEFLIYPIKSGEINIRVTASSPLYTDAVWRKLKVEPEGVPKQKNQALYLSIPKGEKLSSSLSIEKPKESVPESDYITFSVGGHYLVPTVENFNDLIQMPTGTGEQNMVTLAPSILILQYLKVNDKLSKEKNLVDTLLSAIEVGYQQQLSYRYRNGGYSVFGMATDEEPCTWLTAYVVRYFIKAQQFANIENKIIESDLEYLASQQNPNGEFLYTGYLIEPKHKNEYGLTAFILLAFLENEKYATKYEKTIEKSVEFLNSNLNNINDIYILSLVTVAIKAAKHQNANSFINKLKSQVKEDNGLKWWQGSDQNLASDIEITAYAAISLLDTPGDHTSILKWLIKQRNANGGFKSSHDTVVGLEALVKFSEKYKNIKNINLKVSYSAKNHEGVEVAKDEIYMDSDNISNLQKRELPENIQHVTFEIEGNGVSMVQLSHQYNIVNSKEFRHFNIQPKPMFKNSEEMNLEICFSYQMDSNAINQTTNMIIMEANLPSGFTSNTDNKLLLRQNKLVRKFETKNSESTIILYLDKLEANDNHCLEIQADKVNEVLMTQPAAILMYDYYNLSRSNTQFYSIE